MHVDISVSDPFHDASPCRVNNLKYVCRCMFDAILYLGVKATFPCYESKANQFNGFMLWMLCNCSECVFNYMSWILAKAVADPQNPCSKSGNYKFCSICASTPSTVMLFPSNTCSVRHGLNQNTKNAEDNSFDSSISPCWICSKLTAFK